METLKELFARWAGEACADAQAIGTGGSSRRYWRLTGASGRTAIGTVGTDLRENRAFLAFAAHLRAKSMPVPQVYAVADDGMHYLQQDLGDTTLYSYLHERRRQGGGFDPTMLALYRRALADLAAIQQAGADADFGLAYPRPAFDRRAIMWDLNYFKYFFLKLVHADFDEELLEDDFSRLADLLLTADTGYFMYRDFQGRNIMLCSDGAATAAEPCTPRLYYIDFQGARRGAAQYDVASLLYSAKSDLPPAVRRDLLGHYLDVRSLRGDERGRWLDCFWPYVHVRILQTLGAYGYRGLYERKGYFLQSIPLALRNLRILADEHPLPPTMSHLRRVIEAIATMDLGPAAQPAANATTATAVDALRTPLVVTVQSFSYKHGLPPDPTGNGGGHVFDCRALPNPGRYDRYKPYTGRDGLVADFLRGQPPVAQFLDNAEDIVRQSVDKYIERRFTHLSVAFGCTGGQHRSVYCAERLAERLRTAYPEITVVLRHNMIKG